MDENVYLIIEQVHKDIAELGTDAFATEDAKLRMARNEAKLKVLVDFFYQPGSDKDPKTKMGWRDKLLP